MFLTKPKEFSCLVVISFLKYSKLYYFSSSPVQTCSTLQWSKNNMLAYFDLKQFILKMESSIWKSQSLAQRYTVRYVSWNNKVH